jgi:hypothetical protein
MALHHDPAPATGEPRAAQRPDPNAPTATQVLVQMAVGKWVCQALKVAAELAVADVLGDSSAAVEVLALRTGANADALYRLLRALAALGVFEELPGRRFRNNALSTALRSDVPGSARPMVRWLGEEAAWHAWGAFEHSVRTGAAAFDHVLGASVFDYFGQHPATAAIFDEAMTSFALEAGAAVARAYDFSGVETLVDVGGGQGALLAAVADRFPGLRCVLLDRPEVIAGARKVLAATPHAGRIELRPGDFLLEVPAGADAYLLMHILHDWDDERCVRILANCREAMADGGTILAVEQVVEDGPRAAVAKLLDLEMLAMTPGGRERTGPEFAALFERAGLRLASIRPTEAGVCVIEAVARRDALH